MIHMIFWIVPFNLAKLEDKSIVDPADPSDSTEENGQ
jgi:hypothetical protein